MKKAITMLAKTESINSKAKERMKMRNPDRFHFPLDATRVRAIEPRNGARKRIQTTRLGSTDG